MHPESGFGSAGGPCVRTYRQIRRLLKHTQRVHAEQSPVLKCVLEQIFWPKEAFLRMIPCAENQLYQSRLFHHLSASSCFVANSLAQAIHIHSILSCSFCYHVPHPRLLCRCPFAAGMCCTSTPGYEHQLSELCQFRQ